MTQEQEKKAKDALRWNKNVHIQYYICLVLIIYLLTQSKNFKFLSFDSTFNIIVNSIMILSTFIMSFIKFEWKPNQIKLLLYSKYLLSLELEKKKKQFSKVQNQFEKIGRKQVNLEKELKQYD
ncbi:hypothetical protein XF24_00724 [candidate division SR1 bacterium Aalborg_AAW-1]|nr:hypothetical protein XF24_00724 [candidate division SR1 bacterium Aalborg_AAW-1]